MTPQQKKARDLQIDDIVIEGGKEYEVTAIDLPPGNNWMGVTMHGEAIEFSYRVDDPVTVR